MTSKNAAKGGSADFSVKGGAGSFFFTEGDNSDDTQGTARAFTLDETWADWVGMGDATDFRKLELANGTKLVLDLKSSDAATFTIWQDNKGKLKSIQATTLKANVAATTKPLLLNAGTYYLSMTSKNAAKGGAATYSVKAGAGTFFFTKGDNGDDTKENARAFTLDDNWTDWVGMGDETDFRKITLESAAKLVFDLKSGDAATFTIWQDNKGKLKSLQATTPKANVAATTKALLLDAGTYYLSMTAKNAKKGGAADYSVKANASCRIFPAATKNDNGWKDVVAATPLGAGELASGWVGFGDTADYFKLALPEAGTLKLSPDATTANALRLKQLKLTLLDAKGKSVSLANPAADNSISSKKPVAAGEYYLGVVCANPKLYDTSYAITLA